MGFGFQDLIAHAARTRNLHPGTIIGSGTISNSTYRTVGSACIAERRGIETIDQGKASTTQGASIFGTIDQRMVQAARPRIRHQPGVFTGQI